RSLQCALIKIDCEGFETRILRGANSLLSISRPALMIECNDPALEASGSNRRELFQLLRSYSYRLFHLASFTGNYPFGVAIDESFPAVEFNFAAIPDDAPNLERWSEISAIMSSRASASRF
ncbi:MAG: FkbM family methyltransferase, partial [Chthoniobacterales bacterium]